MKLFVVLGCAVLFTTPVLAADFSLEGTYGTPAGCALAHKAQSVPSGKAYTIAAKSMLNGDATCTVLDASDGVADAKGTSWNVKLSCEAGDEVAEKGTVKITQAADKSAVSAHVEDGVGPTGNFKMCPAE